MLHLGKKVAHYWKTVLHYFEHNWATITLLKNYQKSQKSWCIRINSARYSTCHCHFLSCFSLAALYFHLSAFSNSSFFFSTQRIFNSFVYTEKTSNGETEVQQVSYPSSSLDTEWVLSLSLSLCVCGLEGQRTPIKILQLLSAVFEAIFVLSTAETLIPTSIDCTVSLPNKL